MPRDQWKFVTTSEEFEEGPEPEEAALHVEEQGVVPPAEDPGRAEVQLGDDDGVEALTGWFEDEEPEDAVLAARLGEERATDDLEQLLEEQHYSFPPESDE